MIVAKVAVAGSPSRPNHLPRPRGQQKGGGKADHGRTERVRVAGFSQWSKDVLPAQRAQGVGEAGHQDSGQEQPGPGTPHLGPHLRHVCIAKEKPQQSKCQQKNQDCADA